MAEYVIARRPMAEEVAFFHRIRPRPTWQSHHVSGDCFVVATLLLAMT
jgi:hypothetical protein